MRDQYAGDVSDVLKFAFLRALAGTDRKLGIAWYYAPGDDGRPDGRHLEWRDEAAWRRLDEDLHAGLATLPERSIAALERAAIWPTGKLFHREPMPTRAERSVWGKRKRNALDGANLVFLDPDNGIGKETQKHATFSEIRLLRKPGRAIVFITFPGRNMQHDALCGNCMSGWRTKRMPKTSSRCAPVFRCRALRAMCPGYAGSRSSIPTTN